jgi:hypothetical protein
MWHNRSLQGIVSELRKVIETHRDHEVVEAARKALKDVGVEVQKTLQMYKGVQR